jgi:predicted Zn-dependent protease
MSREVEMKFLSVENTYDDEREASEFIESLKEEMEFWSLDDMNEKEEKVLKSSPDTYRRSREHRHLQ